MVYMEVVFSEHCMQQMVHERCVRLRFLSQVVNFSWLAFVRSIRGKGAQIEKNELDGD